MPQKRASFLKGFLIKIKEASKIPITTSIMLIPRTKRQKIKRKNKGVKKKKTSLEIHTMNHYPKNV